MHIIFGSILLVLMADMIYCHTAKGNPSRPRREADNLEYLRKISSTERRCLREEELGRMVNKRYALEQVHRNQQLDAYRAQCMGTPEEAVLQFCWSLGRPANCGFELRTWVAVGDDMLIRCRQQRLVGGPFPIMTADDNRRYSLNSSGIFIRCTNHGILVARQWCGRNFMIREVDERELHQWYEIGGMELSVYDCDPSKGPFSGYPL